MGLFKFLSKVATLPVKIATVPVRVAEIAVGDHGSITQGIKKATDKVEDTAEQIDEDLGT
jgi:hypothetical protein